MYTKREAVDFYICRWVRALLETLYYRQYQKKTHLEQCAFTSVDFFILNAVEITISIICHRTVLRREEQEFREIIISMCDGDHYGVNT